mgnify:FL=1
MYGPKLSRKSFLQLAGGTALSALSGQHAWATPATMRTKLIPVSGEALPVVGLGTSRVFDIGGRESERAPRREVLKLLLQAGGTVIDSSPMYGEAEEVVGDLLRDISFTPKPFVATKVWTEGRQDGIEQMAKSARLLRTPKIDLIQIHNLVDWRTHLKTLRRMKEEGTIRYIGITHYTDWGQAELAAIIGSNQFDFVQTEYAIDTRKAEERLLPLARDKGTAVIINRPFQRGSLFRAVRGEKLPLWAADFQCQSWGQYFLKFVLSHPSVTCTIPGTSKPKHMRDNVQAGLGRFPNEKERQKMVAYLESL